jgi:hypothetical protein
VTLLALSGCGPNNPAHGHTGNGNGNGTGNGDGSTTGSSTGDGGNGGLTNTDGGGGLTADGGNNCGVQNFMLQKGLPPDLLIVLDRSGSMGDAPPAGGGSKWSQVTGALDQTVMSLQGQIKWGLEMFPSDDSCGVSASVDVPIAASNASAISAAIAAKMPGGSTPTADAINKGTSYLTGLTDANPKYIVLATDGEPNCAGSGGGACTCSPPFTASGTQCCLATLCVPCTLTAGGDDAAGAEQAITDTANKGVNTFVVGIAADSSDDAVLNQMAVNGKTARAGTTKYYPVANQSDFVTTVNTIAGQIISCTFPLSMAPANPDLVSISAGAQTVPHDPTHMDGWDYGPNDMSIQFYGSWCTQLQSGSVGNVQAVYGCPPIS